MENWQGGEYVWSMVSLMKVTKCCASKISWNFLNLCVMSNNNRQIFYAVGIGRRPGVYHSWDECKKELIGVVNPIYKKFCSLIEAKEFVKEWSSKTPSKSVSNNTHVLKINNELNGSKTSSNHLSEYCNTTQKKIDNSSSLKGDNIILQNHVLSNNFNKLPICTKHKVKRSHSLPYEKLNFKNEEYLDLEYKGSTYSPVGLVESVYFSNYKSFCISRKGRKQLDNNISQMSYTELLDALKKRSSLAGGNSSCDSEKVGFNVGFNENSEIVKKELFDVCSTPTDNTIRNSPLENSINNGDFLRKSDIGISSLVLEDKDVDEIPSFKLESNIPEITNFDIADKGEHPGENIFSSEANAFETFAYNTNFKRSELEFDQDDLNNTTTQPVNFLNNLDFIEDFGANLKKFLLLLSNDFDNSNVTKAMVTTVAEQIINFISDSLKHITAGIVAAINNEAYTSESSESIAEKNVDHFLPKRDILSITNPCSCLMDDGRNIKTITEKLNNCERKIDKCLNQINMISSGFIEIKNEFKNLFQIMCKNSASVNKVNEKFQSSMQKANYSVSSQNIFNKQNDTQSSSSKSNNKNKFELSELEDTGTNEESRHKKKRKSCSHVEEPNTFIPYDSRLNDEQVKKEKLDYVGFTIDNDDYVVVYTDGACHSNGKEGAKAGIGIWFGDGHPLNVSKPIIGVPTNNNAEIQAARIAIEMALNAGISRLKICTDSEFLINCATAWMKRWKMNNWMTKSKTQVKNKKELEKLDSVMSLLSVRWEKVPGHAGIKGNEMADQLANNGAHL